MAVGMAAQPDMVRAHQKDESYREQIMDTAQELTRRTLGPRKALLYERELQLGSDLIYYLASVGCGQQTLGEEYCDIAQVSGKYDLAPCVSKRTALALMQACGPYLAEQIQQRTTDATILDGNEETENTSGRSGLRQSLQWLSSALPWILRSHLALFYLHGVYYHISHRLTGVRYLFIGKLFERRPKYSLLGMVMLLQLGITASLQGLAYLDRQKQIPRSISGIVGHQQKHKMLPQKAVIMRKGELQSDHPVQRKKSHHRCPLCLSPRDVPTATPCGHMFCWSCVAAWVNQKPECPLCRADCSGKDLVPVLHADF